VKNRRSIQCTEAGIEGLVGFSRRTALWNWLSHVVKR
jgi:hypothetical protein